MVRRYDLAKADPVSSKCLHRVSDFLLGSLPGQLGHDFRQWVAEGRMSARLRAELTAYQLCVLDDSFVEGPHARVSRAARQASRPSPSWWSATVRLEQNFREYDASVLESPGRFHQLFDAWKLVAQFRPSAYLSGQSPKVPPREFLRSVYRTGAQETQRDWTALSALTYRAEMPQVRPSDMEALLKEYLLAVFALGSVMEVIDTRGVSNAELVSGGAHFNHAPLVAARQFYQVVSRTLVSKKFVSTENLARLRGMRVPVVLQRLAVCVDEGQDLPPSLTADPEGFPEVRDVRILGSLRDLRRGLHVWSVHAVAATGSLELVDRRCVSSFSWTVNAES